MTAIPLNLSRGNSSANYVVTGSWSKLAITDAQKCLDKVTLVTQPEVFNNIPDPSTWTIDKNAAFFYYCENETVFGIEFDEFPYDVVPEGQPLVTDMSANFMSKNIDISKYGVIYGGMQKNLTGS